MNTNFNPARVIQTHYKEVPAHPVNGPKHWEVYGRNVPGAQGDVLLGSDPSLAVAVSKASAYISEHHKGYQL